MILRRPPMLLACALLALAGCGGRERGADGTLNVSILTTDAAANGTAAWAPLLADMKAATGLRVERFPGSNDTALIEAMRFRQTDMGWFTPAPALEAVSRAGGEVFARTVRPETPEGDRSVIIVRKGSGLTLERLLKCDRTLAFGIGEGRSISGVMAPATYLFGPRAVDPAACFKSVRAASHESNFYGVSAGVLDAAVNDTASLVRFSAEPASGRGRRMEPVEVIWTSPALPDEPVVWRKDLHPALKAKIVRFVLGYGMGEGREAERQRAVLRAIGARGFARADDRHLLPLQEMQAAEALSRAKARQDPTAIAKAEAEIAALAAARAAVGPPP